VRVLKSSLRLFIAGLIVVATGHAAGQPAYPSKPIRLIVAFPPGGSTDAVGRILSQKLQETLGQPVVVENRPGGNGVIGAQELYRAAPDGYTLLLMTNTFAINAVVMKNLPFDPVSDFIPVSTVYGFELVLVGHPSVPANTLKELLALAKGAPDKVRLATGDYGGLTHLASEALNSAADVRMQNVPYKGSGPALADTIAGHVETYFSSVIAALPYTKTGKLKAFAISGKARSSAMPDVPTFAEQGFPKIDASSWGGIFAPAKTPQYVVAKLAAEIEKVMTMPDVQQKLVAQGLEPMTMTPERFSALFRADVERYDRLIKAANIQFDK
jgi:tripartite-type tricarboxylate transporter receptor subunit TctC